MLKNAKISILGNLSKALFLDGDKTKAANDIVANYFAEAVKIKKHSELTFTNKQLSKYCEFINWKKDEIPPTFPYALMTHMQFAIVTDKKFPFAPFGLIHKNERIECYRPLVKGKWKMTCSIPLFRKVDRGYEIEMISTLNIDGELAWRSTTTAFKRTKKGMSRFRFNPVEIKSNTFWDIPSGQGMRYAHLSNNYDPIHISNFTARIMGQKTAIMHGMWTAARGTSALSNIEYPFKINYKFILPIHMPSRVLYQTTDDNQAGAGKGFGVYSESGKRTHLEATIL